MAKRISPSAVIDLTLESDDEQEARLGDVTWRFHGNSTSGRATKRARTLNSSDVLKPGEDVEVVEACVACPTTAIGNPNAGETEIDSEFQVVGTRNELKLPHLRHDCTMHQFLTKAANSDQLRAQNEKHCELCYCYVCDAPVKDCKSWSNVDGVWQNSHCNATDKQNWWVKERGAVKSGSGAASDGVGVGNLASGLMGSTTINRTPNTSNARGSSNHSNLTGSDNTIGGIYAPGNLPTGINQKAHPPCRHCAWHSNNQKAHPPCRHCAWHSNIKDLQKNHGRCIKCGRFTLLSNQQKGYLPKESDYCFGGRKIGFRIVSKDVRRDKKYRESWRKADATDPRWKYDEAAMKTSVFDFRIGKWPRLAAIVHYTSEWEEEKAKQKRRDVIILDNKDDISLLRLLNKVGIGSNRAEKPKIVRGGIIAEEMGLGKHPAPALPIKGSHISCLSSTPIPPPADNALNGLHWNRDLYTETSTDNKLRGSVLSQGTLVICPVSLVGQWIEEAKSKLSNPGLLYPYHGGNRIRDAETLAKNAIVVTTYQVLASDDTYHRKKSSNPDEYCPPLEQIRWWRIICDEGHSLRNAGNQRNKSLSQLVADNKWMVTGTPVSTSMSDLKNQLKLIGVEHVDKIFQSDKRSMRRNDKMSIEIALSDEEREEYDAFESAAKQFYVQFKAGHSRELSKHYLLLSQKLTPLRVACAGGHLPTNPEAGVVAEDDGGGEAKVRKQKEVKYSDFCFTSKLTTLIEQLKQARDTDPTSKSLVFSQFNSTLEWLKQELPAHGFQFRTLAGSMTMKQRAKALHDFQADPPTTIFLLSMRAGNCGINLTQANRVFLMEPGFNPALEKQAIGRVHRLGQKRNVEIIRLIVKDSIETRICEFLETKYRISTNAASKAGSEKGPEEEISAEVEHGVLVGNLASERPRNKIVTSEFDMLFGVKSESEAPDALMPDSTIPDTAAMPDGAISLNFNATSISGDL
ncbi:unnamed protein product [Cylindrotheca closterium]|uniref:Uncharacterized protein n=1 Tax=Cylindrotheca closterium TaxID=2856 RepID=A0AAD2FR72_9STRA|nr:unnamed protein product [Cylindrotheca closterium]